MKPPNDGMTPEHEQRLEGAQGRAGKKAESEKQLPSSDAEIGEARGAVGEPKAETDAKAKQKQAAKLSARPAPSPEIEKLCANIQSDIRNKRPPDEDAIKSTNPEQEAKKVGQQLNSSVSGETDKVKEGYKKDMEQTPQGEPAQKAKPIEKTPSPQNTEGINAEQAAPDKVPEEQISLDDDVKANRAKDERCRHDGRACTEGKRR